MAKPVVAIVGRPNVGKSSIFNAIAGERVSIVHDSPGVTRDRIYRDTEWYGREFTLVDTGGLDRQSEDEFLTHMAQQVEFAVDTADAIIFLCDIRAGLSNHDREIAAYLRRTAKPIILALNKDDNPGPHSDNAYEFYELGFGDPIPVSAAHKLGLDDLISAVLDNLPEEDFVEDGDKRISVAIIGKPNVGKSSLLNCLMGEERAIVTNIPGTTRDAINEDIDNEFGKYRFIDTAGLRRKSKVDSSVEKYSTLRTEAAIEKADVCLILMDASERVTEQDTKVFGLAHNLGKASLLVLNKWDLIDNKQEMYKEWEKDIRTRLSFMPYIPIYTISALTGAGVQDLYSMINHLYEESIRRLSTSVINEVLAEAVSLHRPPSHLGKALKIYYASQVAVQPPQFVLFINDKQLLHFSYERYIENRFREAFGFEGSPIWLIWRERKRDDYLQIINKSKNKENKYE